MLDEICGYKVHPLAGMVPMANREEQKALQDNIREQGQKVPIQLYRDKIIDGRCRALACEVLGIPVSTENVDNNMSLKQVEELVLSLNIRRNLTASQRAISAYSQWKLHPKMEKKSFYVPWSTSNKMFQAAEELDVLDSVWLDALFNDKAVLVGIPQKNSVGKMVQRPSKSVMAVRDWAKVKASSSTTSIVDGGDILQTSFDDQITALHPDQRKHYHNAFRQLNIDGIQVIKNKEVAILDIQKIKDLLLVQAKLAVIITFGKPPQPLPVPSTENTANNAITDTDDLIV